MTNEEICIRIQKGERELIPLLWESVSAWIALRAKRFYYTCGDLRRVEEADLIQQGFLALMDAVEVYDAEKGSFITIFTYHLNRRFYEAAGLRTRRQIEEPGVTAVSLNTPLNDEDGGELMDLQAGELDTEQEALDSVWNETLKRAADRALHRLDPEEEKTIRALIYDSLTVNEAAELLGQSRSAIRRMRERGIRKLRRDRELTRYLDEITPYYRRTNFNATGKSPVEAIAEFRELFREKHGMQ